VSAHDFGAAIELNECALTDLDACMSKRRNGDDRMDRPWSEKGRGEEGLSGLPSAFAGKLNVPEPEAPQRHADEPAMSDAQAAQPSRVRRHQAR
jgi:hypothetical protein